MVPGWRAAQNLFMRTNIVIAKLMKSILRATGLKTRRQAVALGLTA